MDEDSNATMAEFAREKIRERVSDPKIAEKLSPDYHILTRRLSPETNFLEQFNRDNVDLVDLNEKPIKRFTENGIIVGDEKSSSIYHFRHRFRCDDGSDGSHRYSRS